MKRNRSSKWYNSNGYFKSAIALNDDSIITFRQAVIIANRRRDADIAGYNIYDMYSVKLRRLSKGIYKLP